VECFSPGTWRLLSDFEEPLAISFFPISSVRFSLSQNLLVLFLYLRSMLLNVTQHSSQRAVSEVLKGKRELTAKQIRALASRFHVSPAVFI